MKPWIYESGNGPVMGWNLDASVGRDAQNSSAADITFLQWYYSLFAAQEATPGSNREVYQKVRITGMCTGKPPDPLINAIRIHQDSLKHHTVDGKVSPAIAGGKAPSFFIYRICVRLSHFYPQVYPRLDLIKNCPKVVTDAVAAATAMKIAAGA